MTKNDIYTAFKTRLPLLQDEAIWEAIEMIEDDGGDLVSRQQAIDAVRDGMCSGCWCDVLGNLKNVPSAQPERKKGKWHYPDGKPATIGRSFGVICDQCETESEYCTNFCGECGADMRGESDE